MVYDDSRSEQTVQTFSPSILLTSGPANKRLTDTAISVYRNFRLYIYVFCYRTKLRKYAFYCEWFFEANAIPLLRSAEFISHLFCSPISAAEISIKWQKQKNWTSRCKQLVNLCGGQRDMARYSEAHISPGQNSPIYRNCGLVDSIQPLKSRVRRLNLSRWTDIFSAVHMAHIIPKRARRLQSKRTTGSLTVGRNIRKLRTTSPGCASNFRINNTN